MPSHVLVTVAGDQRVGTAGAGESWWTAARRLATATSSREPWPVDLSGDPKLFAVGSDTVVVLRPMTRGDLPLVLRWRQQDHVRRWWHADGAPTPERIESDYGPAVDGETPTRMWVVEVNGRSVGFVQDYRIRDYPEFALLAPDPDAIGLDYAIGEPGHVGRGLGVRMLWAWMLGARDRYPDATTYFAAPDHRNGSSLRVLDKAGFVRGTWFDEPQRDGSLATVVGCTLEVRRVLG